MNLKATKNSIPLRDSYVVDTMGVVLRLEKRKMPATVKDIFVKAESGETNLFIPAMALAEVAYLSEKERIVTTLKAVVEYAGTYETVCIDPMTARIMENAFEIDDIPELHDRIIAATASARNVPLITNDPVIRESKYLRTVW